MDVFVVFVVVFVGGHIVKVWNNEVNRPRGIDPYRVLYAGTGAAYALLRGAGRGSVDEPELTTVREDMELCADS